MTNIFANACVYFWEKPRAVLKLPDQDMDKVLHNSKGDVTNACMLFINSNGLARASKHFLFYNYNLQNVVEHSEKNIDLVAVHSTSIKTKQKKGALAQAEALN